MCIYICIIIYNSIYIILYNYIYNIIIIYNYVYIYTYIYVDMKNESTLRPSTHVWNVHLIDGLLGYVLPVTPLRSVAKTAFLVQQGCLTESQFCISLNNLLVCMPFSTHKELNTSSFQCSSIKITPPQAGFFFIYTTNPGNFFFPRNCGFHLWPSQARLQARWAMASKIKRPWMALPL